MQKKIRFKGIIVNFLISLFLLLIFLYGFFNSHIMFNELENIIVLLLSVFFFYLGNLFLNRYKNNNKFLKMTLYYSLILYGLLLIQMTIFDVRRGFNWQFIFSSKEILKNYLATSVRLVPFKTTINFIKALLASNVSVNIFIYNILGNIIALIPLAFLLPLIFPKQNKTKIFILTVSCVSLGIELIQVLTISGTFDIDDIILNVGGALIFYFILKINSFKKLLNNIFLFSKSKSKITKKDVLGYMITLVIGILISTGLFKTLNYFKSKEYVGYSIEFIDNTSKCEEGLEKFFEDDKHIYYFNCHKSNNVYVIFNGEEKYLLKDFLNKDLTDKYEIDDLYYTLKNSKIGIKIESKLPKFSISYDGKDVNIIEEVIDENILELEHDLSVLGSTHVTNNYFLNPLKEGQTRVIFKVISFEDYPDEKVIATMEYLFTVSKDLNVTYERLN